MRKLFYAALAAMALALPTMTACGGDDADSPVPPKTDTTQVDTTKTDTTAHHHDEDEEGPARIVLTLSSGHFHGVKFHGDGVNATIHPDDADDETVEPKYYKAVQQITLERNKYGSWQVAEGSDSVFRVLSAGNYATPYGLWITYLAEDGDTLNAEFGGLETMNAHQHFFTTDYARYTFDGDSTHGRPNPDELYTYTYMDTNPWNQTLKDKGTALIGSKFISEGRFTPLNPVGLKGFFTFTKPRTQFDIRVRLKHFDGNSKFVNGEPAAFNKPAAFAHTELEFSFPVIVFASRSETEAFRTTVNVDWKTRTVTNYQKFNDAEKRYVESLRAAYGCSLQDILWDFYLHYDNGLNAESSTLWF